MAGSIVGVTPETMRSGLLRGLLGPGALFGAVDQDLEARITESIEEAEREIEETLSTRFNLTTFQGWMGPGAPADLDQAAGPQEWEGPYDWPPALPGDNFPRFRTKIRPVVSLEALVIVMPGGIQTRIEVPAQWCRIDPLQGELMVAPSLFAAPLQSAGLTGPLILGMAGRQLPKSVLLSYTAGLGEAGLRKYPQIKRLVEIKAAMRLLPELSVLANPETLTSISADGLSQSRSSGFIFKDLEDRLQKEADERMEKLIALWDGPGSMMVL